MSKGSQLPFPFSLHESAWQVPAVVPCHHVVSLLKTGPKQLWERACSQLPSLMPLPIRLEPLQFIEEERAHTLTGKPG